MKKTLKRETNPEKICEILSAAFCATVRYFNNKDVLTYAEYYGAAVNPAGDEFERHLPKRFSSVKTEFVPEIIQTDFHEVFAGVPSVKDGSYQGLYVSGPFLLHKESSDHIRSVMLDKKKELSRLRSVAAYFDNIPVRPIREIKSIVWAMKSVIQEGIDETLVFPEFTREIPEPKSDKYDNRRPKSIEEMTAHHSYRSEAIMLDYVEKGDVDSLTIYMEHPRDGEYGVLNPDDPLRNAKNMCVSAVVLASRAAIRGGMNPQYAYRMSDQMIRGIEGYRTVSEMERYIADTMILFAEEVKKENREALSFHTAAAQAYIKANVYGKLTIEEVAEAVNISAGYLRRCFRKDLNMTPQEYIHAVKADTAALLLEDIDLSISGIAEMLQYADQSHFTRSFRSQKGMTPAEYRKKRIIG